MHPELLPRPARPPTPVTPPPSQVLWPVQVLTMRCSAYESCQEGREICVRCFCVRRPARATERSGVEPRAPAVGCPSLVGASPSPGGFAGSLSQSVSLLLFRGVPARVQRGRVVDRCRRFPSCRTRSSYTSSYPDRCAPAGARSHRPFRHAGLTAATGDSAPSNPRVNSRLTSCSYGLEPPDRKISPALFPGGGRSQNLLVLVED